MIDTDSWRSDDRILSDAAHDLYERLSRGERPRDGDGPALQELFSRQLVSTDPEEPDEIVVLNPRLAGWRYLQAGLYDLMQRADRMVSIPDAADRMLVHYERARSRSGRGCEFLPDGPLVNARIQSAISLAECELLTAQPGGPRTQELLDIALERDTKALERGVSVRTLYRDSVRDDRVTRVWATLMSQKGAQFRTLISPFQRVIIVDRRQAFISDYAADGPAHSAWHVQDRAMVGYIAATFEDSWHRADAWGGDPRTADTDTGAQTTKLQREILRDTAAGIDQRVTAKRLGIGVRTLTKEVGKLREVFGAANLAQLAFQWASHPDRLIDDQPALAA